MKPEPCGSEFPVAEYIPHRAPILGVDRILTLQEGLAVAERRVENGPDAPGGALWEQGLIEGLAQTASALHRRSALAEGRRVQRGMLVGMNRLVFHRRARVGERIEYRAELLRRLEALSLVHGIARVGNEVLAEGDLKFYVEERA